MHNLSFVKSTVAFPDNEYRLHIVNPRSYINYTCYNSVFQRPKPLPDFVIRPIELS